ncbi:MAG: AbrB/MazE/SpoVT family DNA-binding domain-containing protein [Clostridiales bacterium]|nr:AbrB/MazE/SpoVT family DNA-binding domain-containing protein [Clostridiales bacterium]MCF8023576.1 AbrB/MazE/SpoVT family DNA-binding domain-containing protein [Clostridiales bacterium]
MSFDKIKITSKGQLTLPSEIRKKLGLEKGNELSVQLQGEQVILKKRIYTGVLDEADPIWDMIGIFYAPENNKENPSRWSRNGKSPS